MILPKTYKTLRWGDDMDPLGADTASDLESLEQDVLHIIAQALGSNIADQDHGIGAVGYLGGTEEKLKKMPGRIDAQLPDDPRITSSTTTYAKASDGYTIRTSLIVSGQVVNVDLLLGPNGLTLAR